MSQDLTKLNKTDLLKAALGMQESLRQAKAFAAPFFEQLEKMQKENGVLHSRTVRQQHFVDSLRSQIEDMEARERRVASELASVVDELSALKVELQDRDELIAELQKSILHEAIGKRSALMLIGNMISDRDDLFVIKSEEEDDSIQD